MTPTQNDRNADAASLDLEAIKARAAAATEGPWEWDDPTIGQHWSRPKPWTEVVNADVACGGYCYGGSSSPIKSDVDGQFIAHAREDIPALVDEVERLREEMDGMVSRDWRGLMAILEDIYPEDIFPTMADDPKRDAGPRIVSLLRVVDELRKRLRAQLTITDEMVKRGALAMHQITCDTNWHECSHAGPAGCMAIARQVLSAALGGEQR